MADIKQEKTLRRQLKKLFSTTAVIRNVGGRKLRVADTSHLQAYTSRTLYDRFSRVYQATLGGQVGQSRDSTLAYQGARLQLFRDYDIMDNDAIIASALDIYADETTIQSESGESLIIESSDENIREILYNLFYDILNIEFNLWPWVRNMCKYGDFFLFLEITADYGIINVLPLSPYDTIRVEGENPENPYDVYFQTIGMPRGADKFQNFEVAHFRLLSDSNFLPYGKAMIESARRTWKQLQLMEDAMLVHRIVRAPDRRVFQIDIGNLSPKEVDAYMERLMAKINKVPLIDANTGEYNLRYNMQTILEDFYLPVRGGDSGTNIQNLPGLTFNAIEDVEYLKNKLMAALKVPKAFLGYEEALSGKATLAAEDVRFARTIERIQRIVISELTKIAMVHLFSQGYKNEDLVNFSLSLSNPSTIYEQERIALWQEKVRLAQELQQTKLISSDWIYKQIFGLSGDEVEELRNGVVKDQKRLFRYNSIEQGQDPANPQGTQGMPGEAMPPGEGSEGQEGGANLEGLPVAEEGKEPDLDEWGRGAGRPREGHKYSTDRHPLGRDPLGDKELDTALTRGDEDLPRYRKKRRTGMARESSQPWLKGLKQKMDVERRRKNILSEEQTSYIDENQLDLDLDEDEN